jgi:hypothetical protein
MQDVTITFTRGPMSGNTLEFEVGELEIGRQPGANGLQLKNAETAVSRIHALLRELDGKVILHNQSSHGTQVDGKEVFDSVELEPGAEISIGANHDFRVEWTSFMGVGTEPEAGAEADSRTATPGPLASPVIRAVIVVYLLAMVGVAVWISGATKEGGVAADDWPELQAAYETYATETISADLRAERMARAQVLLREVRTLKTRGMHEAVAPVCREIMGLDNAVTSPLFQYGAQCLAAANLEG